MGGVDVIDLHHTLSTGDSVKDSSSTTTTPPSPPKPQTKPEKQKSTNRATVKGGPGPGRKPYLGENLVGVCA
jgi:hypothetical protein